MANGRLGGRAAVAWAGWRAEGREGGRAGGGVVAGCAEICQDDLHKEGWDIETLPCAHIFHHCCLADWRGVTGRPAHHYVHKCHDRTPEGPTASQESSRDLAAAADEGATRDMSK